MPYWLEDIESFEAICQDDDARRLVLRLAQLSRGGDLAPFLNEFAIVPGMDDATMAEVAELAGDASFLLAVEDYFRRTQRLH
jgi:hypothetical protein